MNTPILNEIDKLKNKDYISFHTPGHKGRNTLIDWKDYIPFADLTEVGNLDNLHDPKGIIRDSQNMTSRVFGARHTIYSVTGTTGGLYIGLGALTKPGDKVLIQRNSHKSVYNSCILNSLNIEYIRPRLEDNILVEIDTDELEEKLKNDKSIKLVIITYPNYYGIVSDMAKIVEIIRKYDRLLLVDEAHGSHLVFSDRLPKSSIEYGADIVVQSTHKTLPSFTQTSMIHIASDRVDVNRLREYSSLYQTTSPSYLFMLSLELASAYMEEDGRKELAKNIDRIEYWVEKTRGLEGLNIYERKNKDISKILFSIDGYSGPKLEEAFMESNIYLEMSDRNYGLAIATVMNSQEDLDRLFLRMIELASEGKTRKDFKISQKEIVETEIYPIYEAFYMEGSLLDLGDCLGKVSKSFIIPYPPGIPLLVPGELITGEILNEIYSLLETGIELLGLHDDGKKLEIII